MADELHQTNVLMQAIAQALDKTLNGDSLKPQIAFVVLLANFGDIKSEVVDSGRVNYVSNANREDIACMMKETIARFEGRADDGSGSLQ